MNLQDYINSGQLELYVLDRLTADERREVESRAQESPEIRAELAEIEKAIEAYALARGLPPNPEVLVRLMQSVRNPATATAPAASPQNSRTARAANTTVDPEADVRSGGAGVWIAVLLTALALAAAVYFWNRTRQAERAAESTRTELTSELESLREDCDRTEQEYLLASDRLRLLTQPTTSNVVLAGTDNAPDARAIVFYNPETSETLFSAANLPAPPADRQYQLWAINAEGPQDLGVLDRDLVAEELLEVEFVPGTAAFAITLETDGGNPTPNLEALQVIGNVGG